MKFLDIIKPIIYIITGLVIIIFHEFMLDYLAYVVGTVMIITNIEAIIVDLIEKDREHFGYKIGIVILGILMVSGATSDFTSICVIWATISVINGGRNFSKSLSEIKKDKFEIVILILSLITVVLSIFLIINPLEHVTTHLILLGVEIILDSVRLLIKKHKKYKELNQAI